MTKNKGYIDLVSGIMLLFHLIFLFSCGKHEEEKPVSPITLKVDSLERVAMDSLFRNPQVSHAAIDEALTLSEDSFRFYKLLAAKSQVYFGNSSYDSGFYLNRSVLGFCDRMPLSPRIHALRGILQNTVGNYYSFLGRTDSALLCYTKACDEIQQSDIPGKIPDIYINMGDIHARMGAYDQRANYFRQALSVSDSLGILDRMAFPIYYGLGETYMELRDFEQSDRFYRLAESQLEERNLNEKFTFCNSRGNYYYFKEEYEKALPWFLKAREVVLPTQMDFYVNVCEINLGEIYLCLNRLDSARFYLDRGFQYFFTYQNKTALYHLTTLKASLALKEGHTGLAFQLLNSYMDTVGIDPRMTGIRSKNLQRYYAAIGDYRQAYRYQEENMAIENTFRGERTQMRVADIDMRYRQDTTLIKREAVIREQSNRMERLELSRWVWGLLFVILLIAACLTYVYIRRKRDVQWQRYINQVTKLKMESIRNRVSPHFIFNVLNREISSEAEGSSRRTQLSALVELLRGSLEITERLSVSLREELRFVRTYLELQSKSLGLGFAVEWKVDSGLDLDHIYLPAMLIQIPVENAVKYGLKAVKGERRLLISVEATNKGTEIRIEDNGPGYQPGLGAADSNGTGTGMKVLYRTTQLLNMKNKEKITFSIRSKEGEEGTGTIFTFFIPENYNYTL